LSAGAPRPSPGERLRANVHYLLIVAVFVVFVGGWELSLYVLRVPEYLIPTPRQIVVALGNGFTRGVYWWNTWVTLVESLLGFLIGSAAGLVLGTLLAQFRILERVLYPYLVAFQTLPKIALAPLLILWFGFGMSSKVAIAAMVAFFPVLVNMFVGLQSADREQVDLVRSLSGTRWQIFVKIQFPSSLPFLFAGLDVALVFSILGAIVGEFIGATHGLGALIMQMNLSLDVAGVFSVLVILAVMGVGAHLAMQAIQRRVTFWAKTETFTSL
jgi:NitT/TauT family transport system permease protein